MRRTLLSFLAVVVCLALSVHAAEPFIVLVDEQRGLLLIPEGTAIPMGIDFQLTPEAAAPRSLLSVDVVAGDDPASRRFVYAYAAPERFTEALRRIAEAEAKMPQPVAELIEGAGPRKAVRLHDAGSPVRPGGRVAANIADFDQTYYYYFWDNSYHAMRKKIWNQGAGVVQYTATGWAYSEAGDWDAKVVVNNSCPAPYSAWTQNKTCWFYNAAGTCQPTIVTYVIPAPGNLTATVSSQNTFTRYLYPPCDLPCKSNSTSSMSVSFP